MKSFKLLFPIGALLIILAPGCGDSSTETPPVQPPAPAPSETPTTISPVEPEPIPGSTGPCDAAKVAEAEALLIADLKINLKNPEYSRTVQKIEAALLERGSLSSDDDAGYRQVLKAIIADPNQMSLLAPGKGTIGPEDRISFKGLPKTMGNPGRYVAGLSRDCSLRRYFDFVDYARTSGNLTLSDAAQLLEGAMNPGDLDQQFYQDLVYLSLLSLLE